MSTKLTPHGVISIPTTLDNNFFRHWFEFLRPFHNLTSREMDVITSLTKHRYELSKVIKDDAILDKVVMGDDVRKEVREECNISLPHFQVIMGKLRDSNVIVNNKINPRFIPNIKEEDGNFKLLLLFDFKK
jgi:hypothetical protein